MQLICLHPGGANVNPVDLFAPGGADVNAVDLFAPGELM